MGKLEHLLDVVNLGNADAVAMAHVLHYDIFNLSQIRDFARNKKIPIRDI